MIVFGLANGQLYSRECRQKLPKDGKDVKSMDKSIINTVHIGKNKSSVAFIILNYNDPDTTIYMVNNLCKWTQQEFYMHIVVIDNCSTDGSFEKLKIYYESEPKVDVIMSEYNGGYSYGNNYGSKFAIRCYEPDYIAIANPDIVVDENTVTELLKTFSEDENLLMCAPVMKDSEGKYRIRTQRVPSYIDDLTACFTDKSKTVRYDKFDYLNGRKNMILTEMLPGSFFVVRTKLFQRVGMLDEGVFLFCEERILGYRMKQYGYKAVLRSDLYFIHKHGTSIGKAYKIVAARKMLLKSRCYYQKVYNKCGLIKEIIFKGVSALSLVYLYIKLFASCLLRRVKKNH